MNEEIRGLFPALKIHNYLNSAAVSPMPVTARDAVISQLDDVAAHGSTNYPKWIETKNRSRALLAEMMGVEPANVAFMRNTSDGFASVATGIDWASDDNIVSFANEFPANYYAWKRVRDKYGVDLRLAPERDGKIDLDELISMIDSNTKLVAISAVQFSSGFRADLERIGKAARDHDALFAVDLIQALGTTPFDLPAQYVDIACGASHKWLCAPEGCGYIYLSDRALERVSPTFVGWISVETPWDFADREQPFKANALSWESGTGASSLFYGLEQSLKLLVGAGSVNIHRHLEKLTDMLCEMVPREKFEILSSRAEGEKSQIVALRPLNGASADEIFASLSESGTIVSARNGFLRISPHFYNNEGDIERLVGDLDRFE
ncbi:MAG: aminotransferase class V-fold PLP-dependent enzyme [Pyrinomonadaceae bacterium]